MSESAGSRPDPASPPDAATAPRPPATVYSIPATRLPHFAPRPVVLRTAEPAGLPELLGATPSADIAFIQIEGLRADLAPLLDWGEGLPLDLMLADPAAELAGLYRAAGLLERHPVRVSIRLAPGLAPAVRLALALGFAVRLHGHAPAAQTLAEARQALATWLHNPTVEQAVEPFQSLLLAFLHGTSTDLWSALDEHPAALVVLDDQGQPLTRPAPWLKEAGRPVTAAGCAGCPWHDVCRGYFKWPDAGYDCTDVLPLFADLHAAAADLRQALKAWETGGDAGGDAGRAGAPPGG